MAVAKKVCMLGDFGVGKTSLVRRYVLGQFSPEYQTTLGVNVYKHVDKVEDAAGGSQDVSLVLWDIEGGLQRESLLDNYMRGAAGAIVVGDITRDDHIETMQANADRFRMARPGRPAVFAFNKMDLLEEAPDEAAGQELAEDFGGALQYTSAATGEAVQELFRALAARILEVDG